MCVWVLSRVWLFATPWTVACQALLSMGFSRQELEWVAISSSRGSSRPRDWTCVSWIGGQILYHWATWETPCLCIFDAFISLFCPELLLIKCCVSAKEQKQLWDLFRITDQVAFSLSVMRILISKSKLPTGRTVESCWSRTVIGMLPRRWRQDKK